MVTVKKNFVMQIDWSSAPLHRVIEHVAAVRWPSSSAQQVLDCRQDTLLEPIVWPW